LSAQTKNVLSLPNAAFAVCDAVETDVPVENVRSTVFPLATELIECETR